jgi:hypothetical protein
MQITTKIRYPDKIEYDALAKRAKLVYYCLELANRENRPVVDKIIVFDYKRALNLQSFFLRIFSILKLLRSFYFKIFLVSASTDSIPLSREANFRYYR